jgi:DNA mismatch endonuclease (patch repair protein)
MPDYLSREARSAHMRRIRKVNTTPERIVRKKLYALGFRFRLHRGDLAGTPDIVLSRLQKVIFVHGCFWHQHKDCRLARLPKTRLDYWLPKLRRNQERDAANRKLLESVGWGVLVVWECDTKDPEALGKRLEAFLQQGSCVH